MGHHDLQIFQTRLDGGGDELDTVLNRIERFDDVYSCCRDGWLW
jgi:hypothetical protein